MGIFVSTLLLYTCTSYPTVAYIDSGELAVVCQTLGIAHPTGYPIYTLIGRLFSMLSLELITTQNLFGAMFTALAVTVIFIMLLNQLNCSKKSDLICMAISMLVFSLSPLVWSQGVTNEVYSLHLLFVCLILSLMFCPFHRKYLVLIVYLFGLSFGNHMSTILLLPALLIYLWNNRHTIVHRKSLVVTAITAFIAGISVYFYLPIRSSCNPLFDWGNPSNWENFVRHISGWQYQVWMFDRSGSELLQQLREFLVMLMKQFPVSFLPFIVAGFYFGFRYYRKQATYLVLIVIFNILYALNYSIPDIDNYLLPCIVALFMFALPGIGKLLQRGIMFKVATFLLVSMSVLLSFGFNLEKQDQSGNSSALDGMKNYYLSTEPEALILTADWDYYSPWLYSHFYDGERSDLLMIDTELIRRSWYFSWIRQADSLLYNYLKPEIEAFLPHVRCFEAKGKYNPQEIERTYRAILAKLLTYPAKRVYFDLSQKFKHPPAGETVISGTLFRLVREGGEYTPPSGSFQPPRFGKPNDKLNWRESHHLEMFYMMSGLQKK